MKNAFFSRALPAFALAAVALASLPAAASPYTSLVVFGDSLSDNGNNALIIGTRPNQVITGNTYVPKFPYASGVYSNGPVWASDAALQLGVTLAPSIAGGTDFAYGGATTGPAVSGFPFSLLTQANQYLGVTGGVASPNALYAIAGGGNDARDALIAIAGGAPVDPTILATALSFAANIGTIVDQLQSAGAQHIVVWDTPNIGLAPAVVAAGGASLGSFLAASMNAALAQRLAGEVGVSTFDIFGLGTAGFTNITDACGAVSGANCNSYVYWDGIHPTAAAHMEIADAFLAVAAVPEPSTWVMMILGFAGLGFLAYRRSRKDQGLALAA